MSDTYQVCESCAHRFAVPIGARASKCETCASLDRKDAEITRLHAEAAELRAQLTAGPDKVLRCAFCGFAYPDGTPTHKHESLAAHVRVCTKHPVGKELRALRADLARVEGERDVALKAITGDSKDDDCYLALLIALATNRTRELHPSHLANVLTATSKRKSERDALRADLASAKAEVERVRLVLKDVANALAVVPLGTTDRMRAAGLEYDAKFVDRAMAEWHNVNAALTPPAPQQEKPRED